MDHKVSWGQRAELCFFFLFRGAVHSKPFLLSCVITFSASEQLQYLSIHKETRYTDCAMTRGLHQRNMRERIKLNLNVLREKFSTYALQSPLCVISTFS